MNKPPAINLKPLLSQIATQAIFLVLPSDYTESLTKNTEVRDIQLWNFRCALLVNVATRFDDVELRKAMNSAGKEADRLLQHAGLSETGATHVIRGLKTALNMAKSRDQNIFERSWYYEGQNRFDKSIDILMSAFPDAKSRRAQLKALFPRALPPIGRNDFPVFENTVPRALSESFSEFEMLSVSAPRTWDFWHTWLLGRLLNEEVNFELQRKVSTLNDDIWKQGPEAVAAAIDDIKADMMAEKLPQADNVSFDPDKAVFEATPVPLNAQSLVDTTLKQVAFAQKIASQSNCGFNSNSVAWQYIDYTLEDCREDANAIEQNLEIARSDIVEGLSNGTYFEDAKLSALEQVLDRAVTDLRANHPDVADAWEVRIKHTLRVAKADQKQIIVEKATALIEVTHEKMGLELMLDAKTISTTDGEVQGHAIRRFFGRIAQMRILLRSSEVVRTIDENTAFKATAILLNLQGLINIATGMM